MASGKTRAGARWMSFLMAAAGAVTLLSSSATTEAAWDGTQAIHLGDTISAEFVGAPLAEEHKYSFYVMANTTMNTTLTVDSTAAGLVPELQLYGADETHVDLGTTQTGNKIKNFKFAASGSYYLRVRATAGTGIYKLATKIKVVSPINGKTTTGEFDFDAGAGTKLDATVKKSKGSTAAPKFIGLTYNGGTVDLGAALNATKIKKLVLPVDATYTLEINPGVTGQSVDVKVTLTVPKPKTWSFGHIEDTTGLATQNREKWLTSAHADHTAEAFNHWNEDNPPEISKSCAKCHSTPGYRDYLGADGTAANVVDNVAPIGTVVECDACHNDQALALTSVKFPSGLTVSGLGKEARCMVCHQGRESTVSVDASIVTASVLPTIRNDEASGTGIVGQTTTTVIGNDSGLGTGVLPLNQALAAGTTFTDTGAGFSTSWNDGTYWLRIITDPADLSGAAGAVTTKNAATGGYFLISSAKADSLTLATSLVIETPPAATGFQYRILRVTSIAKGDTFTDASAGFVAAGVLGDGNYYLQIIGNPLYLNGTHGSIVTKGRNFRRFKITAVADETLTLERLDPADTSALTLEAPRPDLFFQYTVAKVTSPDTPMAPIPSGGTQTYGQLGFKNVHYYAAGASLYGREAAGAYEYEEPLGAAVDVSLTNMTQRMAYDRKFTHVASKDTCIECHDPHTQKVRVEECATCHVNSLGNPVANYTDLRDIRMAGTVNDFNGDGDAKEGIWYEIKGLQDTLYAAMQDYGLKVAGMGIVYDGTKNPYFFEAGTTKAYSKWTARLLRSAYNYQYSIKDPGAFAHNGKFIVQFLYDSIADMNEALTALQTPSPVPNFDNLHRNDPGHFDSAAEAYRHWDEDTDHLVDPSCARCHSIDGFQFVAKYGLDTTVPTNLSSGLSCESCHVQGTSFAPKAQNPNADHKPERLYVAQVQFPFPSTATSTQISAVTIANGAKGTAAQDDSYICMTCHRARESKLTLDAADPNGNTTTMTLSFKNSHYLGAGATQFGNKAAVMYQYSGTPGYSQRYDHDQAYLNPYPNPTWERARCAFCHIQEGSHSFEVEVSSTCTYCHVNSTSIDDLTPAFRAEDNWDNDVTTKPKEELAVFQAKLLAAIQTYCAAPPRNTYVAYDPAAYPYFVVDTNQNGVADAGETTGAKFDTKSFRASFNYNFSVKEPGCWAHNPKYVFQVLYDAIKDLGGDPAVVGLTRPAP